MGEDRVTEFGRRHSRNHECLHGSNHLTRLGSQDGASKDPLSRLFDYGLQKTIHLAGGPGPRHGQRSDRNLENSNLQSLGNRFLLRQSDMRQFRIGEKGGRYVPITSRAGTIPKNVVAKNPKVVQGRVGKLGSAAHITNRPDA